jgi:hypothetical protein
MTISSPSRFQSSIPPASECTSVYPSSDSDFAENAERVEKEATPPGHDKLL